MNVTSTPEAALPIISASQLREPESMARLELACRDFGVFVLTDHGIDDSTIYSLLHHARAFFESPKPDKRKICRTESNPWGYFDEELTKNTRDWKEIFDYGPAEGATIIPQWPVAQPGLKQSVLDFYQACERLSFTLLDALCENLEMPEGTLHEAFEPDHSSFMRINYYRPCPNPANPAGRNVPKEGHLGVNHHTDSGVLTVLLQDEQSGLEIYHKDQWLRVPVVPGALTINLGDIAQVWSNDRYHSVLHRVRANSDNDRISVPFFFNPAYQANYAPLPSTITDTAPALYTEINWGEFRQRRVDGDYADIGEEVQISHYRNTEARRSEQ